MIRGCEGTDEDIGETGGMNALKRVGGGVPAAENEEEINARPSSLSTIAALNRRSSALSSITEFLGSEACVVADSIARTNGDDDFGRRRSR